MGLSETAFDDNASASLPAVRATAYPLNLGILQIAGFLLVFVGSIPTAQALLQKIRTHG